MQSSLRMEHDAPGGPVGLAVGLRAGTCSSSISARPVRGARGAGASSARRARVRHANAATTPGVYAHFVEQSDQEAAEKLGALHGGSAAT